MHGGGLINYMKFGAKFMPISVLLPRDYRLCRSIFPEANRQAPLYFLKERTRQAFITLLAVWRLDWVAEAIFWIKRKLRAAFSRAKS